MLKGGFELLYHPDVLRFCEDVVYRYSPPVGKDIALFLPCSARKPYSESRTHRMVRKQLDTLGKQKRDRIHELIVSEPLGIVPREMEGTYPAAHYDMVLESWFPTGSIPRIRKTNGNDIGEIKASATCGSRETDEIVSILADRVASYLLNTRSSYKHRIAFVRSSQRRILEEASRLAGIRIDFVLDRKIVQSIVRRMGDFYWVMNGMRCNESLSILKRTLFAIE